MSGPRWTAEGPLLNGVCPSCGERLEGDAPERGRYRSLAFFSLPGVYVDNWALDAATLREWHALAGADIQRRVRFLGERILCDEDGARFDEFRSDTPLPNVDGRLAREVVDWFDHLLHQRTPEGRAELAADAAEHLKDGLEAWVGQA